MNEQPDARLREALRLVQPPPPSEDQRERLRAAVQAAAEEDERRRRHGLVSRLLPLRPAWRLGLAAVAAATIVGVALLLGMPRTTGPETVSAGEVLEKTLLALSSGRTFQATIEIRSIDWDMWGDAQRLIVERWRLAIRADGSYRNTMVGRPDKGQEPLVDEAYDARRGTVQELWSTRGLIERRHVAPGPPDRAPGSMGALDITAVARALEAAGGALVRSTTWDQGGGAGGRPAWVITSSLTAGPSRPAVGAGGSVIKLIIDKQTSLPLSFQAIQGGVVELEVRNHAVVVDQPLPPATFHIDGPPTAAVHRSDAGFRRIRLVDAAGLPGYLAVEPSHVPAGYRLAGVDVAASSTTANGAVNGRRVFALNYRRGFDYLTVTTRHIDDPKYVADVDPFDERQSWSKMMRRVVRLSSGAFQGAAAAVVVSYGSTTPHLWVVKDDVLLTIGGGASEQELVAIAESLHALQP